MNAGTRLLWIVDPKTKSVAVYAPKRQPTVLRVTDTLFGEDVLPGFSLPIVKIF